MIYTMEYIITLLLKNVWHNEILREMNGIDKVILSKVTKAQKDKYSMWSLISGC